MANFLFHRCGMRHEEFQMSSSIPEFSDSWKRNPLCSIAIRSQNIFCSHGSALQQFVREKAGLKPEIHKELTLLQNELFRIDHQKGELEKHVFEKDGKAKKLMQDQLKILIPEYQLICDQIQAILSPEADLEDFRHTAPGINL